MDIAFRTRNVEVPENLRRVTRERVMRLGRRCGIDRADVCFSEWRNPRVAEWVVCQITLFPARPGRSPDRSGSWPGCAGPGRILRAQAAATEVAVAADRVVDQLEHRAARLQGRLTDRRHGRGCAGPLGPLGPWAGPRSAYADGPRVGPRSGYADGPWAGPRSGYTDRPWGGPRSGYADGPWSAYAGAADGLRGCPGPTTVGSVHFPAGWSPAAMSPDAGDHVGGDAGEAADMGIRDSRTEPMTPEEAALEMGEQGSDIFVFNNAETGRPAVVYRLGDGAIALLDAANFDPANFDAAAAPTGASMGSI